MFSCVSEEHQRGPVLTFGVLLGAPCPATHFTPPSTTGSPHPPTLGQARGHLQAELRGLMAALLAGDRRGSPHNTWPSGCVHWAGARGHSWEWSFRISTNTSTEKRRQETALRDSCWRLGSPNWARGSRRRCSQEPQVTRGRMGDPDPCPLPPTLLLSPLPLPPTPATCPGLLRAVCLAGQSVGPPGRAPGHTGRMRAAGLQAVPQLDLSAAVPPASR